jgi:hypothetical protein
VDKQQESWLILAARTLKFATDHPYAATGIFGAAVGSVVTYRVMTYQSLYKETEKVITPEVYEFEIPQEDLRHMLVDPTVELRWEMPTISVIITSEKRNQPKELPDIQG